MYLDRADVAPGFVVSIYTLGGKALRQAQGKVGSPSRPVMHHGLRGLARGGCLDHVGGGHESGPRSARSSVIAGFAEPLAGRDVRRAGPLAPLWWLSSVAVG
jgi:hypothetical protein